MTRKYLRPDSALQCFWGSRHSTGLVLLGAIAAYFLLSEHRAHVLGAVPLLLLVLACPLIHAFMHRGHARYRSQQDDPHDALPRSRWPANATPPQSGGPP